NFFDFMLGSPVLLKVMGLVTGESYFPRYFPPFRTFYPLHSPPRNGRRDITEKIQQQLSTKEVLLMEEAERSKIVQLSEKNFLLKKLYKEHEDLEERLSRFEKRPFLTEEEQQEEKLLKRKKLL